jgi:SP family sugar:H+ symporter-like MFS transporter
MVWGLILIGGMLFLPESPFVQSLLYFILNDLTSPPLSRHLLGTNREKDARTAIASINGCPYDDPLVQTVIEELAIGIREENQVNRYLRFLLL